MPPSWRAMEDLVEHVVALPGHELALLAPRDRDALLTEEAFEHEEFLPYWASCGRARSRSPAWSPAGR